MKPKATSAVRVPYIVRTAGDLIVHVELTSTEVAGYGIDDDATIVAFEDTGDGGEIKMHDIRLSDIVEAFQER